MYLENRLIAMLDVLGFAERIQTREGLGRTTAQYAELIARAKGHMFSPKAAPGSPNDPEPNFEYGQFVFDTLVLVSYPIDVKSTYRFIFATVLLMELFFAERFPLRGSVGRGDFSVDETVPIFVSDAFKRLRMEETNQQWSGCTILEEVEEIVLPSLLGYSPGEAATAKLRRSSPVHRVPVPLKSSNSVPALRWCLNWSHFLSPAALADGLGYMEGDRLKRQNTEGYLRLLRNLDDDTQTLSPQFSPAKTLKMMKARSGVRLKFEDEAGNGVIPGCSWTFAAFEGDA